MLNVVQPLSLLVIALAGWLVRQQQVVVEYLMVENPVLKNQLGGQRLLFTDEQRIRLAVKAKVLGWPTLDELETLVTPATPFAWHLQFSQSSVGSRFGLMSLVLVMAGIEQALCQVGMLVPELW